MPSHRAQPVLFFGVAVAQDLFVKETHFLAQRGLALQAVDVNQTNLKARAGHDWWVFQITLSSNRMLCMDLAGESGDDGTPVQLWECNGHESQLWFFDDDSYTIAWAGNSNKCLDAGDQQEGTVVAVWECNGQDQQVWSYDGAAISLQDSMCLNVQELSSGTPLEMRGCNSQDQQQFYMQPGITIRMFQNYQICVDLPGDDTTDGTNLWLWECNGGSGQYWIFDSDNHRIQFASDLSKCLDAGDMQAGSNLMLSECSGQDSQAFGYDPDNGALYAAWATQSDASLCLETADGGLGNQVALVMNYCNNCWNQQFQAWGPVDGIGTFSAVSSGDDCPDVPGGPTPPPPDPPSVNVFPSDHCEYDTGVLPVFNSQEELENDQEWSAYFNTVYGGVPSWGYPICPGAFQFLWKQAAQQSGVAGEPTNCAKKHPLELDLTPVGKKLKDGTFYEGNSFLEARDVYGFLYNSKLYGASAPANTYVEVSHTVFPGDDGAVWYYMSVGSGVWLNVGNTAVYKDHRDAVKDMLGSRCHDHKGDRYGIKNTECELDFPALYEQGQSQGLDTIQFTGHHDCTCGPTGSSSYKYKRWCNTEIIYLGDSDGAGNGCTAALKGGWEASAGCNCNEDLKSSTNLDDAVSFANCGSF